MENESVKIYADALIVRVTSEIRRHIVMRSSLSNKSFPSSMFICECKNSVFEILKDS